MRYPKILALLPVLLLCAAPALSQAAVDVSFSVSVAPPELPIVYEQPPLPEPGYIWTPGYWAWDGMDYYWVPGTWVEPPSSDMYWTPGYWGWRDGYYGWNPGYWGPEVGYYGGVNYGFGYTGIGYQGGYWHGGAFFYNRAVANFGRVNVVNVYNTPVQIHERSRVSFNGGEGGLRWRPNAVEQHAMTERHRDPTPMQHQHQDRAASMPAMHVSQNGGRPQILTTQRPADFGRPGAGIHDHQQPGPAMRSSGAGAEVRTPDRQDAPRPEFRGGAPGGNAVTHGGPLHQEQQQQQQQQQPRQEPQPHFASPGPAMRGPGAGPDAHAQDRHEAPRPEFHGGPPGGGTPQPQGAPPHEHEQGGPPHQQGPRPEAAHEQGRHAPEPKHEPEPKHDR